MQRDHLKRGLLFFKLGLAMTVLACGSANAQIHGEVIYLFDKITESNVTDNTTNMQDGVVFYDATLSTDVPPVIGGGYEGNMSIHLDGNGEFGADDPHIRIVDTTTGEQADDLDLALTDLTIEAWIKPTTDRNMTLYQDAGVRNFNAKSIGLRYVQSGYIRWTLQIADNTQVVNLFTPENTVPINEWTHVAARLDRTKEEATIHVNGILAAMANAAGLAGEEIHDNDPVEELVQAVGTEFASANIETVEGWNGFVDEFRLSSVALSDEYIRASATTTLSTTLAGESTVQSAGGTITLTFETEAGDDYKLQTSTAPETDVWTDEPVTIHGSGELVTFKTDGSAAVTVYRLQKIL